MMGIMGAKRAKKKIKAVTPDEVLVEVWKMSEKWRKSFVIPIFKSKGGL